MYCILGGCRQRSGVAVGDGFIQFADRWRLGPCDNQHFCLSFFDGVNDHHNFLWRADGVQFPIPGAPYTLKNRALGDFGNVKIGDRVLYFEYQGSEWQLGASDSMHLHLASSWAGGSVVIWRHDGLMFSGLRYDTPFTLFSRTKVGAMTTAVCPDNLPGWTYIGTCTSTSLIYNDINECNSNPCPSGTSCANTAGSFSCNDINECNSNPCQFGCTNSYGSYSCYCDSGYALDANGLTCTAAKCSAISLVPFGPAARIESGCAGNAAQGTTCSLKCTTGP